MVNGNLLSFVHKSAVKTTDNKSCSVVIKVSWMKTYYSTLNSYMQGGPSTECERTFPNAALNHSPNILPNPALLLPLCCTQTLISSYGRILYSPLLADRWAGTENYHQQERASPRTPVKNVCHSFCPTVFSSNYSWTIQECTWCLHALFIRGSSILSVIHQLCCITKRFQVNPVWDVHNHTIKSHRIHGEIEGV